LKAFVKLLASGFFAGYCPVAPGTIGSLWGIVIYILLYKYATVFVLATLILLIAGFLISGFAENLFGKKDSERIVIDEVASMCLVFIFIKPDWLMLVSGFMLFRFFDIIKPPPAKILESLSGSKAVMLDDIVAAAYTIIALFALSWLQIGGILPVLSM
jgi:phosphatidylglycerophosphatase A